MYRSLVTAWRWKPHAGSGVYGVSRASVHLADATQGYAMGGIRTVHGRLFTCFCPRLPARNSQHPQRWITRIADEHAVAAVGDRPGMSHRPGSLPALGMWPSMSGHLPGRWQSGASRHERSMYRRCALPQAGRAIDPRRCAVRRALPRPATRRRPDGQGCTGSAEAASAAIAGCEARDPQSAVRTCRRPAMPGRATGR